MELELGLKITHPRDDDDITSMADLRIIKDTEGPVFISKETETKFILIAHLRGFRKEKIDIEINEDGSQITISGKKIVQEMVLMGWIMQKKEMEIRAFRKVFRIPDGVILDKIKATFKDEVSLLTILMPKVAKGFCSVGGIEEVKEEEMETAAEKEIRKESEEYDQVEEIEEPVVAEILEKPNEEIVEEKIEGIQDSGQIEERSIDRGQFEATETLSEEFPGSDDGKEKWKENPEESRELETAAERVKESVQKESKEPEVETREEKSQGKADIEHQASVENVEPQIKTEKFQETACLKPEEQAEREPIQTEESQREKIPEAKEPELGSERQDYGPEITKSIESGDDTVTKQLESASSSSIQDEEKHITSKDYQMESEKPGGIQELTKTPQEPEPEVPQRNEIEEEETGENQPQEKADDHESHELEKQRGLHETEAAQMKKNLSKKSKVCPPLVVAGSALLVSLIVLVFHLIRSKKR